MHMLKNVCEKLIHVQLCSIDKHAGSKAGKTESTAATFKIKQYFGMEGQITAGLLIVYRLLVGPTATQGRSQRPDCDNLFTGEDYSQ